MKLILSFILYISLAIVFFISAINVNGFGKKILRAIFSAFLFGMSIAYLKLYLLSIFIINSYYILISSIISIIIPILLLIATFIIYKILLNRKKETID